jgi:pimeloyl-ACP methyl ester carboxylesterase
MAGAAGPGPDRVVVSRDGTPIATFVSGPPDAPVLVLVHGATADHTAFRHLAPLLVGTRRIIAVDRRGRGASGDTLPYAIEREFEDVAAVAEDAAIRHGVAAVDVFGHSFGGRVTLGAALRTPAIRRVVSYEGAPAAAGRPYQRAELVARLRTLLDAGDLEGVLEAFMRAVVAMDDAGIARFRADPVWPARVAAAPTIVRELEAERDPAADLDGLGAVRVPVLQVLGRASLPAFAEGTASLAARLVDGRVAIIDGAAHAAHHTHPESLAAAVLDFLDEPG